jgi:hypothetical protein
LKQAGIEIRYENSQTEVKRGGMDYNEEKIDETVLALLLLTLHDERRAWKGHDWDVLDRLYEKGFIHDPKNKNKSVVFTEEGLTKAKILFEELFGNKSSGVAPNQNVDLGQ